MAEIFENSTPEEEMVSWLQYRLEADDKDYCCGIFGGEAESILDLPPSGDEKEKEIAAEAAVALRGGRAAGNVPQMERQIFQEVRISKHAAKHGLPPRPQPMPGTVPSLLQQQQALCKAYQSSGQAGVLPTTKFHASLGSKYPELSARDTMSTVAATSIVSATTVMESSALESSSTVIYVSEAGNKTRVPSQCANSQKPAEKVLERNESWSCSNGSDHSVCKSMNLELDSPGGNECGNLLNENRKIEVQIPCKPSITSSLGGSLSSTVKEAESGKKRKQEELDEMEYESEEAEELSGDTSKQPDISKRSSTRTNFLKRSRAAQVHNLSEKRRRSRINEKMKALQSLIPNSNKTDKASMLDEAIEYLKLLQLQAQLLSTRNGMNASPMYVPVVPYMQMPQMCIGMNMGHAGMHRGMGLSDTSQGCSGQPMLDLANPRAGCCHPMANAHMLTTITDTCGSMQTSCGVDSSQVDIPSLQLPAASQEMYTAYLLPQQPTHSNHLNGNQSGGTS